MRLVLLLGLFGLLGCSTSAPEKEGCIEFDHDSVRNGIPQTCRMVWCEETTMSTSLDFHSTGGVAALWCDPK